MGKKKHHSSAAPQPVQQPAPAAPRRKVWEILCSALLVAVVVLFGVWLNQPDPDAVASSASKKIFETGRVAAVTLDEAEPDERSEGRRIGTQELQIEVLSGTHKGEIMPVTNYMSALFNVDVEVGDRVIVRVLNNGGEDYLSIFNYDRGLVLGGLLLVFSVLLVALGGKKGLMALLGLGTAVVSIWFILIPGVLHGLPGLPLTVGVTAFVAAATLVLLNGYGVKTFCAVLGCVAGTVAAALCAAFVGVLAPIDGFNMTEAEDLLLYGSDYGLHITELLVCGVIIAALGAVMDVALSLASAIWELHLHDPEATARTLFLSGMQIGRDAMGTMANTLILAFAGSSLNMLILIQTYGIPWLQLVNTDFICIEVIQSLAASIGILLTVPLVAFISAQCMVRVKAQV